MNMEFKKVRKNIGDTWARMKEYFNEVYGIEENKNLVTCRSS